MPSKKKKDKKKEKKENLTEQIPALDRQFYELTIADLNNKLIRLRSHNSKFEEQNDELEMKIKQIEEDKADITSYLNRTLNEKLEIITELEDKLTELHKVREEENFEAQNKLKDWENKYKGMHDQLTSEIKLLNGKLNSLEEFRIQRDELMAKFDEQGGVLRDEQKKHKQIIYEMEQKLIQDKDKLRKEVDKKLLELSNEFNQTREIRVAAHTQRLVRENIAITNEMNKMLITQTRLQNKFEEMSKLEVELKQQSETELVERKKLIRTCNAQLGVIERLTRKYENIVEKNNELKEIHKDYDHNFFEMNKFKQEMMEYRHQAKELEKKIVKVEDHRKSLQIQNQQARYELEKIYNVIKTLRATIKTSMGGGGISMKYAERENLLVNLLHILTGVDEPKLPLSVDISSPKSLIYKLGNIGFVPKSSRLKALIKKKSCVEKLEPIEKAPIKLEKTTEDLQITLKHLAYDPIIDIDQDSTSEAIERDIDDSKQGGEDKGESEGKASDGKSTQRSTSRSVDDGERDSGESTGDVEDRGVSPVDYDM